MEIESGNPNLSRRTSAGSEAEAMKEQNSGGDKSSSQKAGEEQHSNSNQEDNDDDDKEGDDDDDDDKEKVIEKSQNERFLKKNAQILSYKVPGVNAYVSFEIKTGKEVLWNDVIGESAETKEARLLTLLKKMRRSYHPNCMRILDCWRHENRISFITERPDETYTTLRHWFNISRLSRNSATSKRLIRQVVSGLKYLADHSLVHGNISTDSILIYGTNVKLGPFSLDAFWHSHTVRKTTKNNFYLSSDWSDPAARITSLTDAYAMGVLCLEIVLWGPLDNELGESDVDVPKYVLDKVEQFDDPLLRSFTKVCMSGNRQHGINELFDVSAFFEPPSLRHASAKVITDAVLAHFANQSTTAAPTSGPTQSGSTVGNPKQNADINGAYQQLLRHARSSFEDDTCVAQVNRNDGVTRQLLFKDLTQYYISFKFLEDIDHGYYPMIKFDSTGRAIVPPHVRRIINGEWQKDEKDSKKEEKTSNVASNNPTSGATSNDVSVTVVSEVKGRKESKEMANDAGSARAAASDKVSPPRGSTGSGGGIGGGSGTGSSTPSNVTRQPTASPARQPSKLPVADSQGVRRSQSISALASGTAKTGEAGTGSSGSAGMGSSSTATATTASSAASTAANATGSSNSSSTPRSHSGVGTSGAKDSKRSSMVRGSSSATGGPSSGQTGSAGGTGSGAGGGGSTGASSGGASLAAHSHGVTRRTGGKAARGASRSSTGSTVGVRRRGGTTSPMPQRARLMESGGRMTRGGRSHGPRVRRVCSEGTTREHHRRSAANLSENRLSHESTEKSMTDTTSATSNTDNAATRREDSQETNMKLATGTETSNVPCEVMHSSDEEYEDDYEEYYEDDLEELHEEDEIEYESQFEQRGRRGQEDHMLNIITNVERPVEAERGSAYFTDVFYEYLGLGRWLLVVKFHLLRCRDDPRGNPYREVMLQLKDHEWHDVDALVDRLTSSGLLMRVEERSILRQYLDAARHNRPLRETYVQNGITGPDPGELIARLLTVQKEMLNRHQRGPSQDMSREEKASSLEPSGCPDQSGQSSRQAEGSCRLRSNQATPAPQALPQPHSAACQNTKEFPTLTVSKDSKESSETKVGHEAETEGDDEGSGKRTFACSCVPGTHGQNPLEPLNKYCPFCDWCDYLLVDGPVYLRSPCYHCRAFSAEKEGVSPEQLYRLHIQNRVPWPLFLQKYFSWPPDDLVTDEMSLSDCKWRSRVVCVCFHDQEVWPPCVEFPWLYNPPQGSIAYRMQVEQFSPSSHLEPMNLWCRRQSKRTEMLKNVSALTSMFRTNEQLGGRVENGASTPQRRQRTDRDPELTARHQRRARSLTVGSEHSFCSQLFSMSIAMHHPPTSLTVPNQDAAPRKASAGVDDGKTTQGNTPKPVQQLQEEQSHREEHEAGSSIVETHQRENDSQALQDKTR